MKLFDFLKKKEKKPVKKVKKPEKKVKEPIRAVEKEAVAPKKAVAEKRPKKKKTGIASSVLTAPHITEKATGLAGRNQYIFKVFDNANKQMIKEAVEQVYDVDVVRVRTITVPRKHKRLGRTRGWRQGYKKAIVSLKQGQELEIMPR